MLRRTQNSLRYVNGFAIGSRGQKHQFYAPVPFLYRVQGRHGPTPYLSKYMHTLGCLPNGVEVPFRLDDFHSHYIREHVPAELEDWLRAVVFDPAETISEGMAEFLQKLQNAPLPPKREVFQRSHLVAEAKQIHAPLQRVFDEFSVEIPIVAVRAAASSRRVKEDLLDAGFAYREAVAVYGSTPHRRWANLSASSSFSDEQTSGQLAEKQQQDDARLPAAGGEEPAALERSAEPSEREMFIGRTLSSVISLPADDSGDASSVAAPDEKLAAKLLTTLAEGCQRGMQRPSSGSNSAGLQLLEAALKFGQNDSEVASSAHTNLASAATAHGDYDRAQFHAREALLVARKMQSVSNPRAQATLAVATALRDDVDMGLEIAALALQENPDSRVLQQVHQQIARAAVGRIGTKELSRQKRYQLSAECERAMYNRGGRFFGDETNEQRAADGRIVDYRMSRTEARLGHAISFSGWGSGPKNHTNMEETR